MADVIDTLVRTPEPLRQVTITGPEVGTGAAARHFWILSAGAPRFGRANAWKDGKRDGTVADHSHPVRVMAADAPGDDGWYHPRLVSVHVVAGATAPGYVEIPGPPTDSVTVAFTASATPVAANRGRVFRTVPESGSQGTEAPFVHVVGEPLPEGPWTPLSPAEKEIDGIPFPPLRLVAGRVRLDVVLADAAGNRTGFAWLERLGIRMATNGKRKTARIWLVPDGIEFDAVLPFPDPASPLAGRVLLAPRAAADAPFSLTLLAAADEPAWREAWRSLVPAPAGEDALLGLKFAGRVEGPLPAFRWPVLAAGDKAPSLGSPVVPAADLRVALVSPSEGGEVDGVAVLRTGDVRLRTAGSRVTFSFGDAPAGGNAPALELGCKPGDLVVSGPRLGMTADARRLAAELRGAYGVEEASPSGGAPAAPRPVLPAFVPLDDGWLQIPIPNLGPANPEDARRALPGPPREDAFDGYFRMKQTGGAPEKAPDQAPWSVTVERAERVHGVVTLRKGADGPSGALEEAKLDLFGPTLSTRGLVWVSADRPDAFEALPRLGAGPGAFVDVALGTVASDGVLRAEVGPLTLRAQGGPGAEPATRLDELRVRLAFDADDRDWEDAIASARARESLREAVTAVRAGEPGAPAKGGMHPWPSVAWLRHPVLPLAAGMPMTRVAAGSVRPLESRDLIPFTLLRPDDDKEPVVWLATLTRAAGEPFPRLAGDDPQVQLRPLAAWPWADGSGKASPVPVRGVAFAALGVPGVEIRPQDGRWTSPGEVGYDAAVRYDLPALDEAFATATLPPPRDAGAPGAPAAPAPPPPASAPATALDWPALVAFWREQERRLQNARVEDSYLTGFAPADPAAGHATTVDNLVRGLRWSTTVAVATRVGAQPVPLGRLSIGGRALVGDAALEGYSSDFDAKQGAGTLDPVPYQKGNLRVIGFSPSTLRSADGGVLDNQLSGAGDPGAGPRVLSRPVTYPGAAQRSRLVSLVRAAPVRVAPQGGGAECRLSLWFKDVLFEGLDAKLGGEAIDFEVWKDPARRARAGFEWRLAPEGGADADGAFRAGRDEIPLFGFRLEPLRLAALTLGSDSNGYERVQAASILCRMSLGPRERAPHPGANVVLLRLAPGAGDVLDASFEMVDGQPLQYRLEARSREGIRRARVEAVLGAGPGFRVEGRACTVTVAGVEVPMGAPSVTLVSRGHPDRRSDRVLFRAEVAAGTAVAAMLVRAVTLGAGLGVSHGAGGATVKPLRVFLRTTRQVVLAPAGGAPGLRVDLMPGAPPEVTLLGRPVGGAELDVKEGNGVLALTLRGTVELGARWTVSLGLLARLAEPDATTGPGVMRLDRGKCEGELLQGPGGVTTPVRDGHIAFTLAAPGPEEPWTGSARVWARVAARSDIRWPALEWDAAEEAVPFPALGNAPNDGRVRVRPGTGVAQHLVSWTFAGQQIPIETALGLACGAPAELWAVPVVARHTLRGRGRVLRWTSVETVAVGGAEALVPRPISPGADDTTFAARYRDWIVAGGFAGRDPGMRRPGVGDIATVLQGTLGAEFRTAFWARADPPRLLMAGGFLGILGQGAEAAPLLRLPVLFGTGVRIRQSAIPAGGIELAWADGPAAGRLARTRPGAPSPANAAPDAIAAALLAGSRAATPRREDGTEDAPIGALLVEQSLVNAPVGGHLASAPYFLAAAVSVERTLREAGLSGSVDALSLVAGAVLRPSEGAPRIPLAAAVLMRDAPPAIPPRADPPRLVVVGESVTLLLWNGPDPEKDAAGLAPVAAGLAVAHDAVPRAAMVVGTDDRGRRFETLLFPTPSLDGAQRADAAPTGRFADAGRGALLAPGSERLLDWILPPVEGDTHPVRDGTAHEENPPSGVAGLTRPVALPGHAAPAGDVVAEPEEEPRLVWLSQTQVPVYLPLLTPGLLGPPVGWLTPAPPRVRLPVHADVARALAGMGGAQARHIQPFLPDRLRSTSVGERAGVLTARRVRLLAPLGKVAAFDPVAARFGRPGQAGSSFPRVLRTPRPGPLPPNTASDATHHRRTQASYLRPTTAFDAVIGSADRVEGGELGRVTGWSVTAVAAPAVESTLTERWDGTVCVECRMEVALGERPDVAPDLLPRVFAACVLLGKRDGAVRSGADLRVDDATIPFRTVRVGEGTWVRDGDSERWRATVGVLLSAAGSVPERPLPAIAAALSAGGRLPRIELHWTVHPGAEGKEVAAGTDETLASDPAAEPGQTRAPLTLRLPLYPVTRSRGALPLTPATVLFSDPAYDRDLASPPLEDGARVDLAVALPRADRGDLLLVLAADRAQVNVRGTVTLMLDARYERRLDAAAQAFEEAYHKVAPGGDLILNPDPPAPATLPPVPVPVRVRVQPRGTPSRPLRIRGQESLDVIVGEVYELALATLTELDGSPARVAAGDVLVLEAAISRSSAPTVYLWNPAGAPPAQMPVSLAPRNADAVITRSVRLVVTAHPVAEPPSALYAVLLRTHAAAGAWRIGVPLHGQSPLPWRVDLADPARDFRAGTMRRRATFVWTLLRPRGDLRAPSLFVVKQDRNGQTHLPADESEFLLPQ